MFGDGLVRLTWADFELFLGGAARHLREVEDLERVAGIYGEPRGGLPIAVALSHRLGLPLLEKPGPRMLWVDDIVDEGTAYRRMRAVWGGPPALSWVARRPWDRLWHYQTTPEWVVFPWEVHGPAAVREQEQYRAKLLEAEA